jgi:hypothetical protein
MYVDLDVAGFLGNVRGLCMLPFVGVAHSSRPEPVDPTYRSKYESTSVPPPMVMIIPGFALVFYRAN